MGDDHNHDPNDDDHKLTHFSHAHPLKQAIAKPKPTITCSGCNHTILESTDCKFSLHQLCHNLPPKTHHLAHPLHILILEATNPSTERAFTCEACKNIVSGLYYTCSECDIYYHILYSALPLSVSTNSHPHTLHLEFSPPYEFFCDLCNNQSSNGWLYRCNLCEFDTHLECAVSDYPNSSINHDDDDVDCQSNGRAALDQELANPSFEFSDAYFFIEFSPSQVVGHQVTETVGYNASADDLDGTSDHGKMQGFDHTLYISSDYKVTRDKILVGGGIRVWEELSQKREDHQASKIKPMTQKYRQVLNAQVGGSSSHSANFLGIKAEESNVGTAANVQGL